MEDCAHQEFLGRKIPVVLGPETVRVYEHVGHVLSVTNLMRTKPDLKQGIEARCTPVIAGGVETQAVTPEHLLPPARGECPVLALDVVDENAPGPGKERGHHPAHALSGARRSKTEDVLRTLVTEIDRMSASLGIAPLGEEETSRVEEIGAFDFF
jgi:hypothetical protein